MESFTGFTVGKSFHCERWSSQRGGTVNGDNPSVSESVGSVQSRCRPESRV